MLANLATLYQQVLKYSILCFAITIPWDRTKSTYNVLTTIRPFLLKVAPGAPWGRIRSTRPTIPGIPGIPLGSSLCPWDPPNAVGLLQGCIIYTLGLLA